ncbi:MAG: iron-containing alcohol dehydrogenase, partial [Clostridiales bacterium]|nr:iron-containing alcohol dehydrogenase [Clostridiales bacterium]
MLNFDLYTPARLVFGKDTQHKIGKLLKPHTKKVLLHYGGGSIKRTGLYDQVIKSLKENGIAYVELGGVKPNPRLSLVHEGIELCRREKVDLILAVGGGSTIDSAKAIAMGVYLDHDVWDVYEKGLAIEKALPVAIILTIPAAGSEASGDTVISNEETQRKYGYGSPHLRPLISIMNPELFFTLPKDQIANGVADMM